MSNDKIDFANTLADTVYLGMNDCFRFGMAYGCQIDCPVLQAGKCELQESDNKKLYQEYLKTKQDNSAQNSLKQ